MRKTVLLLASMALALLLACGAALAAAGDLDPSFDGPSLDGDGKVVLEQAGSAGAVAVHPDGGLVVAGTSDAAGSSDARFLVMRLKSDGSLDGSFGGGDGVVTTNMSSNDDAVNDVLVQPDGKIVAAGVAGASRRDSFLALVRYDPDGNLDRCFGGGDGKVFTKPRGVQATSARALLRQPNDKLVVAGSAYGRVSDNGQVLLVRYLANGRRDESFGGGDGIVSPKFEGLAYDVARRKTNGKIVVAGSDYSGPGEGSAYSDFMFMRRLPDGSPDKSFSGDGKKLVDAGSGVSGTYVHEAARALILRPDGKIVAAGGAFYWATQDGDHNWGRLVLVRLEPNGALDKDFGGGDGKVLAGMNPFGAYDLLRQQDDKLIAVGTQQFWDNCDDICHTTAQSFALRRYNPNGSLDASFGSGGEVLTAFPEFSSAYDGALQANGKAVAAGEANGVALARYLSE